MNETITIDCNENNISLNKSTNNTTSTEIKDFNKKKFKPA